MPMRSRSTSTNVRPFVLREKPARSRAGFKTLTWEPSTTASNGANQCDGCPVQNQCTRAKNGRRILVVGLRHDLVEKRRKEMSEAEFSKSMHPRNGIEGTHSELVRGHGLRRTKYRGLSRVGLSHYFMGAACNVKRYLNLLAFQMRTAALNPA